MYDDTIASHPHLPVPAGADTPRTREIIVNGTRFRIGADQLDHAQLVSLAFPDPAALGHSSTSMTVTYRGGPHTSPDGILAPAERTAIVDGETFVVTRTDKS